MMHITEDTPPDMLAGAMDLTVHLPGSRSVKMSVERSTPMMDVLVQITTAHHLQHSGYVIEALGMAPSSEHSDKILPYKPNTPIGTLDTQHIRVVPKARTLPVPKNVPPGHQPFETTFRLKVHLPRKQLFVSRVSKNVLLDEIMRKVCDEKNLDPAKYEFRHPENADEVLDPKLTLSYYHITEIYLVAKGKLSQAFSASDIMALRKDEDRKQSKSSGGVFNLIFKRGKTSNGSGSLSSENRSISPTHSDDSRSVTPPAIQQQIMKDTVDKPKIPLRKRRPAPKPPQPKDDTKPDTSSKPVDTGLTICHSRNSSDSSGYHEASILSDNANTSLPRRPQTMLPNERVSHLNGEHSKSTGNLTAMSLQSKSTSSLAFAGRKKKAAPPPPVLKSASSVTNLEKASPVVASPVEKQGKLFFRSFSHASMCARFKRSSDETAHHHQDQISSITRIYRGSLSMDDIDSKKSSVTDDKGALHKMHNRLKKKWSKKFELRRNMTNEVLPANSYKDYKEQITPDDENTNINETLDVTSNLDGKKDTNFATKIKRTFSSPDETNPKESTKSFSDRFSLESLKTFKEKCTAAEKRLKEGNDNITTCQSNIDDTTSQKTSPLSNNEEIKENTMNSRNKSTKSYSADELDQASSWFSLGRLKSFKSSYLNRKDLGRKDLNRNSESDVEVSSMTHGASSIYFGVSLSQDVSLNDPDGATKHSDVISIYPEVALNDPEVTSNYPQIASNHPEVAKNYPEVATSYSEVATNYPEVATNYPEVATVYPEVATIYPEVALNYPDVASNHADVATNYMDVASNYPDVASNYLDVASNYRDVASKYPEVAMNYLEVATNYPDVASNYMEVASNYPEAAFNYPEVATNYPEVASNYPDLASNYMEVASNYPEVAPNYAKVAFNYPEVASNYTAVASICPDIDTNYPGVASNYSELPSAYPEMQSENPKMSSKNPEKTTNQPELSAKHPEDSFQTFQSFFKPQTPFKDTYSQEYLDAKDEEDLSFSAQIKTDDEEKDKEDNKVLEVGVNYDANELKLSVEEALNSGAKKKGFLRKTFSKDSPKKKQEVLFKENKEGTVKDKPSFVKIKNVKEASFKKGKKEQEQASYEEKKQTNEGRKQNNEGRKQKYEGKRQNNEGKKQNNEGRKLNYEGKMQNNEGKKRNNKGRKQSNEGKKNSNDIERNEHSLKEKKKMTDDSEARKTSIDDFKESKSEEYFWKKSTFKPKKKNEAHDVLRNEDNFWKKATWRRKQEEQNGDKIPAENIEAEAHKKKSEENVIDSHRYSGEESFWKKTPFGHKKKHEDCMKEQGEEKTEEPFWKKATHESKKKPENVTGDVDNSMGDLNPEESFWKKSTFRHKKKVEESVKDQEELKNNEDLKNEKPFWKKSTFRHKRKEEESVKVQEDENINEDLKTDERFWEKSIFWHKKKKDESMKSEEDLNNEEPFWRKTTFGFKKKPEGVIEDYTKSTGDLKVEEPFWKKSTFRHKKKEESLNNQEDETSNEDLKTDEHFWEKSTFWHRKKEEESATNQEDEKSNEDLKSGEPFWKKATFGHKKKPEGVFEDYTKSTGDLKAEEPFCEKSTFGNKKKYEESMKTQEDEKSNKDLKTEDHFLKKSTFWQMKNEAESTTNQDDGKSNVDMKNEESFWKKATFGHKNKPEGVIEDVTKSTGDLKAEEPFWKKSTFIHKKKLEESMNTQEDENSNEDLKAEDRFWEKSTFWQMKKEEECMTNQEDGKSNADIKNEEPFWKKATFGQKKKHDESMKTQEEEDSNKDLKTEEPFWKKTTFGQKKRHDESMKTQEEEDSNKDLKTEEPFWKKATFSHRKKIDDHKMTNEDIVEAHKRILEDLKDIKCEDPFSTKATFSYRKKPEGTKSCNEDLETHKNSSEDLKEAKCEERFWKKSTFGHKNKHDETPEKQEYVNNCSEDLKTNELFWKKDTFGYKKKPEGTDQKSSNKDSFWKNIHKQEQKTIDAEVNEKQKSSTEDLDTSASNEESFWTKAKKKHKLNKKNNEENEAQVIEDHRSFIEDLKQAIKDEEEFWKNTLRSKKKEESVPSSKSSSLGRTKKNKEEKETGGNETLGKSFIEDMKQALKDEEKFWKAAFRAKKKQREESSSRRVNDLDGIGTDGNIIEELVREGSERRRFLKEESATGRRKKEENAKERNSKEENAKGINKIEETARERNEKEENARKRNEVVETTKGRSEKEETARGRYKKEENAKKRTETEEKVRERSEKEETARGRYKKEENAGERNETEENTRERNETEEYSRERSKKESTARERNKKEENARRRTETNDNARRILETKENTIRGDAGEGNVGKSNKERTQLWEETEGERKVTMVDGTKESAINKNIRGRRKENTSEEDAKDENAKNIKKKKEHEASKEDSKKTLEREESFWKKSSFGYKKKRDVDHEAQKDPTMKESSKNEDRFWKKPSFGHKTKHDEENGTDFPKPKNEERFWKKSSFTSKKKEEMEKKVGKNEENEALQDNTAANRRTKDSRNNIFKKRKDTKDNSNFRTGLRNKFVRSLSNLSASKSKINQPDDTKSVEDSSLEYYDAQSFEMYDPEGKFSSSEDVINSYNIITQDISKNISLVEDDKEVEAQESLPYFRDMETEDLKFAKDTVKQHKKSSLTISSSTAYYNKAYEETEDICESARSIEDQNTEENARGRNYREENARDVNERGRNVKERIESGETAKEEKAKGRNDKQGGGMEENAKEGRNEKEENADDGSARGKNIKQEYEKEENARRNEKDVNAKVGVARGRNEKQGNENEGNGKEGNEKERIAREENAEERNARGRNEKQGNEHEANTKEENAKGRNVREENVKEGNARGRNEEGENEQERNIREENTKEQKREEAGRKRNCRDENKKKEESEREGNLNKISNKCKDNKRFHFGSFKSRSKKVSSSLEKADSSAVENLVEKCNQLNSSANSKIISSNKPIISSNEAGNKEDVKKSAEELVYEFDEIDLVRRISGKYHFEDVGSKKRDSDELSSIAKNANEDIYGKKKFSSADELKTDFEDNEEKEEQRSLFSRGILGSFRSKPKKYKDSSSSTDCLQVSSSNRNNLQNMPTNNSNSSIKAARSNKDSSSITFFNKASKRSKNCFNQFSSSNFLDESKNFEEIRSKEETRKLHSSLDFDNEDDIISDSFNFHIDNFEDNILRKLQEENVPQENFADESFVTEFKSLESAKDFEEIKMMKDVGTIDEIKGKRSIFGLRRSFKKGKECKEEAIISPGIPFRSKNNCKGTATSSSKDNIRSSKDFEDNVFLSREDRNDSKGNVASSSRDIAISSKGSKAKATLSVKNSQDKATSSKDSDIKATLHGKGKAISSKDLEGQATWRDGKAKDCERKATTSDKDFRGKTTSNSKDCQGKMTSSSKGSQNKATSNKDSKGKASSSSKASKDNVTSSCEENHDQQSSGKDSEGRATSRSKDNQNKATSGNDSEGKASLSRKDKAGSGKESKDKANSSTEDSRDKTTPRKDSKIKASSSEKDGQAKAISRKESKDIIPSKETSSNKDSKESKMNKFRRSLSGRRKQKNQTEEFAENESKTEDYLSLKKTKLPRSEETLTDLSRRNSSTSSLDTTSSTIVRRKIAHAHGSKDSTMFFADTPKIETKNATKTYFFKKRKNSVSLSSIKDASISRQLEAQSQHVQVKSDQNLSGSKIFKFSTKNKPDDQNGKNSFFEFNKAKSETEISHRLKVAETLGSVEDTSSKELKTTLGSKKHTWSFRSGSFKFSKSLERNKLMEPQVVGEILKESNTDFCRPKERSAEILKKLRSDDSFEKAHSFRKNILGKKKLEGKDAPSSLHSSYSNLNPNFEFLYPDLKISKYSSSLHLDQYSNLVDYTSNLQKIIASEEDFTLIDDTPSTRKKYSEDAFLDVRQKPKVKLKPVENFGSQFTQLTPEIYIEAPEAPKSKSPSRRKIASTRNYPNRIIPKTPNDSFFSTLFITKLWHSNKQVPSTTTSKLEDLSISTAQIQSKNEDVVQMRPVPLPRQKVKRYSSVDTYSSDKDPDIQNVTEIITEAATDTKEHIVTCTEELEVATTPNNKVDEKPQTNYMKAIDNIHKDLFSADHKRSTIPLFPKKEDNKDLNQQEIKFNTLTRSAGFGIGKSMMTLEDDRSVTDTASLSSNHDVEDKDDMSDLNINMFESQTSLEKSDSSNTLDEHNFGVRRMRLPGFSRATRIKNWSSTENLEGGGDEEWVVGDSDTESAKSAPVDVRSAHQTYATTNSPPESIASSLATTLSSNIETDINLSKENSEIVENEPEKLIPKKVQEDPIKSLPKLAEETTTQEANEMDTEWQYQLPSPPRAFRDSSPIVAENLTTYESTENFKGDSVVTSPELFEKLKIVKKSQSDDVPPSPSIISEDDKPPIFNKLSLENLEKRKSLVYNRELATSLKCKDEESVSQKSDTTSSKRSSVICELEEVMNAPRSSTLTRNTKCDNFIHAATDSSLPNFKITTYDMPKKKINIFEDDSIRSTENPPKKSFSNFIGHSMENISYRKDSVEEVFKKPVEINKYKAKTLMRANTEDALGRSESFSTSGWVPRNPVKRSKSQVAINQYKDTMDEVDGTMSKSDSLYDVSGLQSLEVMRQIQTKLNTPSNSTEHLDKPEPEIIPTPPKPIIEEKPKPPPVVHYVPPSINLSTWSERPKSEITLKADTDYKYNLRNGSTTTTTTWKQAAAKVIERPVPPAKPNNVNVKVNGFDHKPNNNNVSIKVNGSETISAQPSGNVIIKIGANNDKSTRFGIPYRKPLGIISNSTEKPQRPHSIACEPNNTDISRVPIVRSVEYKKTFKDLGMPLSTSITQITNDSKSLNYVQRINSFSQNGPNVKGFSTNTLPAKPKSNETSNYSTNKNVPFSQVTLRRTDSNKNFYDNPNNNNNIFGNVVLRNTTNNMYNTNSAKRFSTGTINTPPPPPILPKMTHQNGNKKIDADPRDELLSAIRNFGGKKGLKAVNV